MHRIQLPLKDSDDSLGSAPEIVLPEISSEDEEILKDETEEKPEPEPEPEPEAKVEEEKEEELPPSIYPRPTIRDLKAKYPTLLKDFPDLKHVLFREQAYTDVFATVDDAKEARERAEAFSGFEQDLLSGNIQSVIEAVGEVNKDAAQKIVNSFIPSLYKISPDLYFKTVSPIIERFVRSMLNNGKKLGNENIVNSALYALEFGGFSEQPTEQREDPKIRREREELEAEKQRIQEGRAGEIRTNASVAAFNTVFSEINSSLAKVKGSDYQKQAIARDIMEQLDSAIASDEKHMQLMKSLWSRAHKVGYSGQSVDAAITAYLSRARAILPSIRQKVLSKAMGKPEPKEAVIKTERNSSEPKVQSGVEKVNPKKIDWRKTSDEDILNDKVITR